MSRPTSSASTSSSAASTLAQPSPSMAEDPIRPSPIQSPSSSSEDRPMSAPPEPRDPSTPLQPKKRKLEADERKRKIEASMAEAGAMIKSFAKQDADDLFGKLIADMMRGVHEGPTKDNLKLQLLQNILNVKHTQPTYAELTQPTYAQPTTYDPHKDPPHFARC